MHGHARAATPVPGGVGPMKIACLLANAAQAAGRVHRIPVVPTRTTSHHAALRPAIQKKV